MSEELKQKAREELSKAAAQFVIDRAKMRGLTIDQFLQGNAIGLMAEFASQVCEQREKEPFPKRSEVCISLFGCCDSEETWRPGIEGWGDSDEKSRSNGYISVGDYDELFNRAEAAELALQTLKEDVAKADKAAVKAMKLVLAQARQQAVADLKPHLRHSALCKASDSWKHNPVQNWPDAWQDGDDKVCTCGLAFKLRSLTPPPALTKEK